MGNVTSQMVDQLEKTWGIKFDPGFNDKIQFMGHLWEPLNASWRPLFFYLCTELIGCFARTLLKRWGFDHHKHKCVTGQHAEACGRAWVMKAGHACTGSRLNSTCVKQRHATCITFCNIQFAAQAPAVCQHGTDSPAIMLCCLPACSGLSYFTLNVGRPKACARATSNNTVAEAAAAAAAVPGSAAPTVSRPAAALPAPEPHQQQALVGSSKASAGGSKERTRFGKEAAAAAPSGAASSEPSASRGSSRSTSPNKGMARVGSANGLCRAKSSPFEAGPPDWTPFADPETHLPPTVSGEIAAAAAAAAATRSGSTASSAGASHSGSSSGVSSGSSASASASGSSVGPLLSSRQATANMSAVHHSSAGAPLVPGLSMHTSIMLRGAANPLQGALSEGLGSADTPVLFLHGVGGLPAYLEMILHVMGLGHPVIVVEFKGVSMRLG